MDRGPEHCTGGSDQNHPKEKEKQEGKAGDLRRAYEQLKKEEKQKARDRGKGISN